MPKKANGRKWMPIGSIPRGVEVEVQTVYGLECRARVLRGEKIRYPDDKIKVKRINAKRLKESGAIYGDVRAVAWREAS